MYHKHIISPYHITPESNINVTRIKEIITSWRSSWFSNKFSLSAPQKMCKEQILGCKRLTSLVLKLMTIPATNTDCPQPLWVCAVTETSLTFKPGLEVGLTAIFFSSFRWYLRFWIIGDREKMNLRQHIFSINDCIILRGGCWMNSLCFKTNYKKRAFNPAIPTKIFSQSRNLAGYSGQSRSRSYNLSKSIS